MRKNFGIKLTVLTLAVMMLVGVDAFAFKGMGKGGQGRGIGGCPMATQNPMAAQNLTDEQITQLQTERNVFITATEELRKNLTDKQGELITELQAENTSIEKVEILQKELLDLKGQFSQKWVDHYLKMKAISPELIKNIGGAACMGGCGGMGCLGGAGCGGMRHSGGQGMKNQARTNCPMVW